MSTRRSRQDWMPNVFAFVDYVEFLRAYRAQAQQNHSAGLTWRDFAALAGYRSPAGMQRIIGSESKNKLTLEKASLLADNIGLDEAERHHLLDLVEYDRAESYETRQRIMSRMLARRSFRDVFKVKGDMFLYYSAWYYTALREMVGHPLFREDSEALARQMRFRARPVELTQAIEHMIELGILGRDEDGELIDLIEGPVGTSHDNDRRDYRKKMNADVYRRWYQGMLDLARQSIGKIPSNERLLGSWTVELGPRQYEACRKLLQEFIESVQQVPSDVLEEDRERSDIYHINAQLFPLTSMKRGDS